MRAAAQEGPDWVSLGGARRRLLQADLARHIEGTPLSQMKEATNQSGLFVGGLFACPVCMPGVPGVGQASAGRWLRLYRSHVSHCFIDCTHIDLNPRLLGAVMARRD